MSDNNGNFESRMVEKLRDAAKRFLELCIKMNYKGHSAFQSKMFLVGFSVFLSVTIWALVALNGNTDASRTLGAEIKYTNLPRGYSLYAPVKKLDLRMMGKINQISGIQPADIVAEVDLANLQAGKYTLPIRVEAPSFAHVRRWTPDRVDIEIYRNVERTLTIASRTEGNPPEGMVVSAVTLDPDSAVVSGPENDVLSVQGLETVVQLDKLDDDGNMRVPVIIKSTAVTVSGDRHSQRIAVSPTETNAHVAFENEIVGERIPVRVSVIGQPHEGLQVESIKVIPDSVSIRGRSTAVRKMQSLVLPPVDISGLDQNIQLMIPMQPAELDPDVEITGTDRARVEIRLAKKLGTKTFTMVPLMVEGAESGKEWKISPHFASVTVEGPQMAIDELRMTQSVCDLYVDVSNIVSKQMTLPVLVRNLKKEFQVVRIEPEQVLATVVE